MHDIHCLFEFSTLSGKLKFLSARCMDVPWLIKSFKSRSTWPHSPHGLPVILNSLPGKTRQRKSQWQERWTVLTSQLCWRSNWLTFKIQSTSQISSKYKLGGEEILLIQNCILSTWLSTWCKETFKSMSFVVEYNFSNESREKNGKRKRERKKNGEKEKEKERERKKHQWNEKRKTK